MGTAVLAPIIEHAMKMYRGVSLDGGQQSASCSGCFTLRERAPGTNRIKGCVRPERSGQDKNLLPLPGIERRFLGRPAMGK